MEYINFALSSECKPILANPEDTLDLDRSVLDSRCLAHSEFLENISRFMSADYPLPPEESALVEPLLSIRSDGTYVLSLSGGVDSMCMLVLLRKARVPFVAVHIRHSSRIEDTRKELDWVRFVCRRLHVPLYYHHVLVARPHGEEKGEISRDEFEDYTRRIRFGMYRKAALLHNGKAEEVCVLIGHHMDDVDENRIAELGKGNLIDIDGMTEEGETGNSLSSVTQLRPFCRDVRKCQLRQFAIKYGIPHMKNSTPKWSKRGWIRDVLDQDDMKRGRFVVDLEILGSVSRRADCAVNLVCEKWAQSCPIVTQSISADTKSKKFVLEKTCEVDFDQLIQLVSESVVPAIKEMAGLVNEFAPMWNTSFKKRAEERQTNSCPIQEIRHVNDDGDELLVLSLVRALQVFFGRLKHVLGIEKFVPRKSVAQLVELTKSGRACVTWKINRVDVHMIRVQGKWYVMDTVELEKVVQGMFAGSREAFRKCVVSNPDKIRLGSC